MKKILRTLIVLIFTLIILSIGKTVKANSISGISMDIYVKENGDAEITEIWNCYTNNGTESNHPYYNLGNSEIKNLTVSENGRDYTTLGAWDTSGSLQSKAYKCGLNKLSNGVEICWGISNYGKHTYAVKYEITNFVAELKDSQMIYWTLIPYDFSNSIGNAYIKIHTDFRIQDTIDVWGYGNYGGTAYVYDGYIEMQSDGNLDEDEYMTILVKFPLGTFNSENKLNDDFNYYYEMAQEGSVAYNRNYDEDKLAIIIFITIISFIICVGGIIGISVYATQDKYNYGPKGKKIEKDVPYYRDIPCNKDIFRAYYIGTKYGLIKKNTDILGAVILKWIKDQKIRVEQKEKNGIFKKEETTIVLNEISPEDIENETERKVYKMLLEASKDGILENKEFEVWCKKHYSKILKWFDDIIPLEEKQLIAEGKILVEQKKKFKIYKHKEYTFTDELRQEAEELGGLRRYLKDYTLIKEREAIEVKLFEEYLIFAQIMGIAKEVAKEFKDLYPEIIEQSNYNSYDNIIFIHMCTTNGTSVATTARARAEGYSSGGGGFSSGGGGGGSFGGGGGRRRFPLKYYKFYCKFNYLMIVL